jgi:hypothetical protein
MTAGSDVYHDFVKALLDAEITRKTSLETRGIAVITTSGTLVTLLFGLVAVLTSSKTFAFPTQAHGWLTAALVFFVLAAGLGITSNNIPLPYGEEKITKKKLQEVWGDTVSDAQAMVTVTRLRRLKVARKRNSTKASIVVAAGASELLALGMLATALYYVLQVRP